MNVGLPVSKPRCDIVICSNDTGAAVVPVPFLPAQLRSQLSLLFRNLPASLLCTCLLVILRVDLDVVVADDKNHGCRPQE